MKSTGIFRPVDELGRIVLPKEMRKAFDINTKDLVEIFTEGDSIILKKQSKSCVFCNGTKDLIVLNEKCVCSDCAEKIKELKK